MEFEVHVGRAVEEPYACYVNDRKHPYYGYRARVIDTGTWEDARTKAEAIGKLVIKLDKRHRPVKSDEEWPDGKEKNENLEDGII